MINMHQPSEWKLTELLDISEVKTGKVDANHAVENGSYTFFTCALEPLMADTYSFDGELIVLPGNGANVGHVSFYQGKIEAYQRTYVLHQISILPKFVYYYLLKSWKKANEDKQFGSATNYIKMGNFKDYAVPLPSLPEQKVITEKLDTLLAQVETTKARLESTLETLKQFRQSVLAAAVSGKLTEDWRAEHSSTSPLSIKAISSYWEDQYNLNGKKVPKLKLIETDTLEGLPDTWLDTKLGQVFDVYVGATPSRGVSEYWNGDIPWVSSSEVAFCRIDTTKETITKQGLQNTSTSLHPPGTVMLAMIGQGKTRGQVAILDIEACHNQNTAALRIPEGFVVSEFLYFFLTKQYEETRRVGGGNNQKALNKSFVQSLAFSLPPFEEQKEIVRRVEALFDSADATEQQVNQALERVNNLTQSVLAKAFRGELTEQWRKENPELISGDNSAEALLKQIKAARAAAKPKRKTKK
jgi:type I restriction enzyme, S subunit